MNGSIIGAELWRLDANDEKTGDVIASLSHTMGEDVEGYFGLLGAALLGLRSRSRRR